MNAEQYRKLYMPVKDQILAVHDLPVDIKASLRWYTTDAYEKFNQKIRKEITLSNTEKMNQKNIDRAFSMVPPLKNSIVVYKGKKSDKMYSDKSYISTSLLYDQTKQFRRVACCVVKITVSPGSKILPLRDTSDAASEEEVLLDRGGTLLVTGSEINHENMKIIYATYVPKKSTVIKDEKQLKKAEEKFDHNLAIERIVEFFKDEDPDFLDKDEVKILYKKIFKGREISPKDLDIVMNRLGIS